MAIKFDLSTCAQTTNQIKDIECAVYKKLILASREASWIRFTGLPVGLFTTLLTVVICVANTGEAIIKGLGNIIGSPFSKDCSFLRGLTFTFIVPAACLVVLPIAAAVNGVASFITGYRAFNDPEQTYDNLLKSANKDTWTEFHLRDDLDYDDAVTQMALANFLLRKENLEPDDLNTIDRCCIRALDLGDQSANIGLGKLNARDGNLNHAVRYFKDADQAGVHAAAYHLAYAKAHYEYDDNESDPEAIDTLRRYVDYFEKRQASINDFIPEAVDLFVKLHGEENAEARNEAFREAEVQKAERRFVAARGYYFRAIRLGHPDALQAIKDLESPDAAHRPVQESG